MLIAFGLLLANVGFYFCRKGKKTDKLYCYIWAAVLWTMTLLIMTESFSALHMLRAAALVGAWICLDVVLSIALLWQYRRFVSGGGLF